MISASDKRQLKVLKATTVAVNRGAKTKEYFDRLFSDSDKATIISKLESIDLSTIKQPLINQNESYYYGTPNSVLVGGTTNHYRARTFSSSKIKKHSILGPLKKELDDKLQQAYGGNVSTVFKLLVSRTRQPVDPRAVTYFMSYDYKPTGIAIELKGSVNASLEQLVNKKNAARVWKKDVAAKIKYLQELHDELTTIVPDEE